MLYRDLVNRFTAYEQQLRDRQIELNGISTTFYVAGEGEEALDYFGDQMSLPANLIPQIFIVIPDYAKYYMLIGLVGESDESGDLPLEVKCETAAYIPVGTVFSLPIKTGDGIMRTEYWRVQSSEIQHIDVVYGKVLSCVPARQGVTGGQLGPGPTIVLTPGPATYPADDSNFDQPVS